MPVCRRVAVYLFPARHRIIRRGGQKRVPRCPRVLVPRGTVLAEALQALRTVRAGEVKLAGGNANLNWR